MPVSDDLIQQITQTTGPQGRLVLGMGLTGLSMARWLHARGLSFRALDTRTLAPAREAVAELAGADQVRTGVWPAAWFAQAEILFVSPGVALADPLVAQCRARGVRVVSDIELYMRSTHTPVVAITGSNGKSTVVSLLAEAARASGVEARAGGNIGRPVLDLLAEKHDLTILELSSFQLEMVDSLGAQVAMILNLSPDHQDRYPCFADYRAAKQRIFNGSAAAVIHVDDAESRPEAAYSGHVVRYARSSNEPDTLSLDHSAGVTRVRRGAEVLWQGQGLYLKGLHNELNILALFATASYLGWDPDAVGRALVNFRGLPHRCEPVAERGGVTFINDSKGTNVGATLAAVRGLLPLCAGRLHLLLGGDAKGAVFTALAQELASQSAQTYCFGQDGPALAAAMRGEEVPVRQAGNLSDALRLAWQDARVGDWIVLSPACASLDQFVDYRARGQAFVEAVRALEVRPGERQCGGVS